MAIECDHVACKTYAKNFPKAKLHQERIENFIMPMKEEGLPELYVDVLHLSPPCQYFSPAHTVNGPNDEENIAALFVVSKILAVMRPRVVTLEQTYGLQHGRHEPFLNGLVNMFTTLGYSIGWKVLQLADYGIPQSRKRLVIIASAYV